MLECALPKKALQTASNWRMTSDDFRRHSIALRTCRFATLQRSVIRTHPRHVHVDSCLRTRHRRCFDDHIDATLSCGADLHVGVDLP